MRTFRRIGRLGFSVFTHHSKIAICPSPFHKIFESQKMKANRGQLKKNPQVLSMSKVLNAWRSNISGRRFVPSNRVDIKKQSRREKPNPSRAEAWDNRYTTIVSKWIQHPMLRALLSAHETVSYLLYDKQLTTFESNPCRQHGTLTVTGAQSMVHANWTTSTESQNKRLCPCEISPRISRCGSSNKSNCSLTSYGFRNR